MEEVCYLSQIWTLLKCFRNINLDNKKTFFREQLLVAASVYQTVENKMD